MLLVNFGNYFLNLFITKHLEQKLPTWTRLYFALLPVKPGLCDNSRNIHFVRLARLVPLAGNIRAMRVV